MSNPTITNTNFRAKNNSQNQSFGRKSALLAACATLSILSAATFGNDANALVTPSTVSPSAVVDTSNTRPYWVGLGIRNESGNSGGTCTGLLINPRAVLFAAHCVDSLNPEDYDGNSVGNRAQVGYTTDATFGQTNLRNWLFGQDYVVPAGDGRVMTDSAMVWYDPRSRYGSQWDPDNGSFLPADIAIAGFDTPTDILGRDAQNGIGLLFSQVKSLVPITVGGYGTAGNGLTGSRITGEASYYRRLGRNMLGYLGDERSITLGVYGPTVGDLLDSGAFKYQDMYWVDFDDPQRSIHPFSANLTRNSAVNTFDFDVFTGAAVDGEAITGSGDSGSPLVTDAFGREVSLGVLSSGTKFFFDVLGYNDNFVYSTTFSNYGSISGYNPLFLFWDQIVINNPYKYVGAKAGDGEWTDANHWVQEIDPLYYTLSGTSLTNALPTAPAAGSVDTATNVGTITPNPAPPKPCAFLGNCTTTTNSPASENENKFNLSINDIDIGLPVETDVIIKGTEISRGVASTTSDAPVTLTSNLNPLIALNTQDTSSVKAVIEEPAPPSGTLDWWDGLLSLNSGALTGPGTSGFVPDNVIGVAGLQNSTRWFEVNLRNAGTTYLTAADIEIDRLNVRGASSALNIRAGASLTTNLSSYLDNGSLLVNGTMNAPWIETYGGLLGGSGTINAFEGVYALGGTVTAGTKGGVGTLNINGAGLLLGPDAVLGVDIASLTSFDKINLDGEFFTMGGLVANFLSTDAARFGNSWNIVTTGTGADGEFAMLASNLSGVLRPTYSINGNIVTLSLTALPFAGFTDCATQQCQAFANALDDGRTKNYKSLSELYSVLDLLNPTQLEGVLNDLAPWDNQLAGNDILLHNEVFGKMVFGRISAAGRAGALAQSSSEGLKFAANNISQFASNNTTMTDVPTMSFVKSNDNGVTGFAEIRGVRAKGKVHDGFAGSLTDGVSGILGFDHAQDGKVLGGAIQFGTTEGNLKNHHASAKTESLSATIYGGLFKEWGAIEGYVSAGSASYDMKRIAGPFMMEGDTSGETYGAGLSLSHQAKFKHLSVTPQISVNYAKANINGYSEKGAAALNYADREMSSTIGRLGLTVAAEGAKFEKFKPWGSFNYASELDAKGDEFGDFAFVNAADINIPLMSGKSHRDNWGEIGIGFDAKFKNATIGMSYETTFQRVDYEVQIARIKARFDF